jgi:hypothetical protein
MVEGKLRSNLLDNVASRYRTPSVSKKENLKDPSATSMVKHCNFGRVPEYLNRMHEAKARAAEDEADRVRKSMIPEGCREMTEQERLETIEEGQKKRKQILDELKRLPLRIETLGQRKQKIQLEHELTEIERTLDRLSQKTVLIKL